jgi:hypothetical protein
MIYESWATPSTEKTLGQIHCRVNEICRNTCATDYSGTTPLWIPVPRFAYGGMLTGS